MPYSFTIEIGPDKPGAQTYQVVVNNHRGQPMAFWPVPDEETGREQVFDELLRFIKEHRTL
jgi:hypothetical protein